MKKHFLFITLLILFMLLLSHQCALAHWGKFTLTDDNGEQVVVKHGLFGKKTVVKDRFGDGFENSKSIFGLTKDTQVNALGNDIHVHKGLFGFSKTEGHDILGDTVSSKKNLFYRNTNVNLSGVNGLLNKYLGPNKVNPPVVMPGTMNQGPIESAPRITPPPEPNPIPPFQTPSTPN